MPDPPPPPPPANAAIGGANELGPVDDEFIGYDCLLLSAISSGVAEAGGPIDRRWGISDAIGTGVPIEGGIDG